LILETKVFDDFAKSRDNRPEMSMQLMLMQIMEYGILMARKVGEVRELIDKAV
jgi:hypothetical protein